MDANAPSSWLVGAVAFGATSLYGGREFLPDMVSAWVVVVGWFVLVFAVVTLCARWSSSRGWTGAHRLALAGGVLLTYVWVCFEHGRYLDVSTGTALLGNVVFGVAALLLLAAAGRLAQQRTTRTTPAARAPHQLIREVAIAGSVPTNASSAATAARLRRQRPPRPPPGDTQLIEGRAIGE